MLIKLSREIEWLPTHLWYPLDSYAKDTVRGSHGCNTKWLLQMVDLGYLVLPELPEMILGVLQGHHKHLETLDISGSRMVSLQASIGQFRRLRNLFGTENALTSLPNELEQCVSLTSLELAENDLPAIPDCVFRCPKLESIGLSWNSITQFSDGVALCRDRLEDLDLSNNQITILPDTIGDYSALCSLNLSSNALTSIPSSIGRCQCLRELIISETLLTTLPSRSGNALHFNISILAIAGLSICLSRWDNFQSLTSLDAAANFLTALPEWIGNLHELRILSLGHNRLKTLPTTIGDCRLMTEHMLESKAISELPDISCNKFTRLPPMLQKISSMRITQFDHRDFRRRKPRIPGWTQTCAKDPIGAVVLSRSVDVSYISSRTATTFL